MSEPLHWLAPGARTEFFAAVDARIEAAFAMPALVQQRNVERWTSLPARDFLAAGRAGAFPTSKLRRLVMAKTEDVLAWIDSHAVKAKAEDGDEWAASLTAVGARRVAQ